jgi:cytochrome d ubiquinol oxidase subunit I
LPLVGSLPLEPREPFSRAGWRGSSSTLPTAFCGASGIGHQLGYAMLLMRYVADPRQASETDIEKAAWDTVPNVPTMFFAFRTMVGLGFFFILLTGTFFWLSARRRLDRHRWLLRVAVFAIPLPWLAAELGWVVAEVGRQPWIIEGVLPTAAAVSDVGASMVLLTLCGFVVIYSVLFVIEMALMLAAIRRGPDAENEPEASLVPQALAAE